MSAWSHLPNAQHIDRVIASVNQHPDIWGEARNAACEAARDAAWSVALNAAWSAALRAVRGATLGAAYDATLGAAWGAILALIAYDDCEQYLNMTSEELKVWALLSERPAAVLLLPVVVAFERIKKMETV